MLPGRRLLALRRPEEGLLAEEVAVRERPEDGVGAVLAGADPAELAVRDEDDAVDGAPPFDDDVTGRVLLLGEASRDGVQGQVVVVAPQRGQLAELARDHADVGAGGHEGDPAVAQRVGEPPVDAVGAAGSLHPGQQLQQPPRRDALHLRDGLGRGRQVPRGRGAEAQLVVLLLVLLLLLFRHVHTTDSSWSCGEEVAFGHP
ncbi:hypothetical protein GCM10023178_27960 [Actinomadura luteofluorescens]